MTAKGLCALAAIFMSAAAASARTADPAYPAATCAALWRAHERTLGPGEDPAPFRDVAMRLSGEPNAVDAFIAEQTPLLAELIYAYADHGDRQSREIFERLLETCEAFAAEEIEARS